jgi:hypothetical protein
MQAGTRTTYSYDEWQAHQREVRAEFARRLDDAARKRRSETKEQRIERQEREGTIVRDCAGCQVFFDNPDAMGPSHKASDRCESGKRSHCTCDTCF